MRKLLYLILMLPTIVWAQISIGPSIVLPAGGSLTSLSISGTGATASIAVADTFARIDTSSASKTINLTTAAGNAGKSIVVVRSSSDANTLTLDPNSSETINGSATYRVGNNNGFVHLVSDGSNWRIVAESVYGTMANGNPASASSGNAIIAPTSSVIQNPLGAYSTSTGEFTIPAGHDGVYLICAFFNHATGTGLTIYLYVNGVANEAFIETVPTTKAISSGCLARVGSAGDAWSIRPNATFDASGANYIFSKVKGL